MSELRYQIEELSSLYSPALVVFKELVQSNIEKMVRIAGGPKRLRPHCKTHKTAQVIQMQQSAGIEKFKCATIAEADMLASCEVRDIFLAYNVVGPNIERVVDLKQHYPDITFAVTCDHETPLLELSTAATGKSVEVEVLLDVDTGLHRTGLPTGQQAAELYRRIASLPGVKPGGLHVYDGHNHQSDLVERSAAVEQVYQDATRFRDKLVASGLDVPRLVAGGTGSFPCFANHDDPALELSPGTVVFHDQGYRTMFPDLDFEPAAFVLTRVISVQGDRSLTFDAGNKSVAADPPQANRLYFPEFPDARIVMQNEEHLVVETPQPHQRQPGDALLAIPWHICPTTALHQSMYVIEGGKLVDQWRVTARDRKLNF